MRTWYEPHLERLHDDHAVRRGDLPQLEQIAAGYPSRERFLTELTLDPPSATGDRPVCRTATRTTSSSRRSTPRRARSGSTVFVLNCVDGCIPSDLATGTTRRDRGGAAAALRRDDARKDSLHLVQPLRLFVYGQQPPGDRHVYARRTRFIPDGVLDRFERVNWPAAAPVGATARRSPTAPRIDVRQRMRGQWADKTSARSAYSCSAAE